ncbi:hypothetical protein [Kitasatospora terrestris]|uniref:hypothetical protein n=1 Tax=Kitasatospora terrestris TaxID=258051 RepID=UPI0031E76B15
MTRTGTLLALRRWWYPPGLRGWFVRWDGSTEPVRVRAGTWRVPDVPRHRTHLVGATPARV